MAENDEPAPPPLQRQLPPGVFFAAVAFAVLAVFYIVGKATPSVPQAVKPGQAVPDFSTTNADGGTLRLSDFKGKVVLINFWATWCGPCRTEIPDLIALQKKYGAKGFTVLGISDDDAPERARDFARTNKMMYPIGMATPDLKKQFGGVPGLPTSFLLDRNGKIVWSQEGVRQDVTMESVLAPEIEKIL